MTATVEAALAFLESQLGVAEYPAGSNANWLTDWYGMGHVAWCAITVSRALIEAGFGTADHLEMDSITATTPKGWAYCPYIEADFRAAGRWHDGDPEPGDLVLYDWDGDEWPDHVGMLQRVDADGTLWVYEGNTDEGVLRLKHRSMTYVRGFARPPYTAAPTPPQEEDMAKAALGVYDHDNKVWLTDGMIRRQTNDPFVYLNAGLAEHLGTFNDGQHNELIDRGDLVEGELLEAEGIDVDGLAAKVATKLLDILHDRLAG